LIYAGKQPTACYFLFPDLDLDLAVYRVRRAISELFVVFSARAREKRKLDVGINDYGKHQARSTDW
jgi:hypothetical protein